MAPTLPDLGSLTTAICRGMVDGNAPLIQALTSTAEKRHELRNELQQIHDKVWEHDGELRFLKGAIISLNGNGDGSSGMVPGLQRDVKSMGAEVGRLASAVNDMSGQVCKLNTGHDAQKSWTDGWKGVGVAVSVISTCMTVAGSLIAFVVYVFTHGVKR